MSSFGRRSLLCAMFGAAAVPHVAAGQPAFPSRPIRVIMPHTAGSYDVYARLIAPRLQQVLGQPFVVDHRPGANGNIALAEIGRAAPDGHTLLFGPTGTLTANVSLYRNMPLDPVDDLAPIVLATTTPMVWLTQPNSEIDGLPTLLRIAKSRPGLLNYSFPGIGTLNHLVAEAFKQLHRIDIQGVPASGPAASMVEAIAGRVHVAVESLGSCWDHVSTGRLRALAVTTRQRISQLPQVPTTVELGLENREYLGWYAFLAPRNTPAAIIGKLNDAINEALRQPEVEARVRGLGASVAGGTPEELRAFLVAERATWREVIRRAGIELS